MTDSKDFWELILRDAQPPELKAEVEEWITKLYEGSAGEPGLRTRYGWLRGQFRSAAMSNADIDEMVNDTFRKYLDEVASHLWRAAAGGLIRDESTLMPAIRWVAQQLGRPVHEVARECLDHNQHEELIDRFYGIDILTQEDREEDWWRDRVLSEQEFPIVPFTKPVPGSPVDLEALAFHHPKAMLTRIAKNVLSDRLRKSRLQTEPLGDKQLNAIEDESFIANPEERASVIETHARYRAGLRKLPDVQRAAWVLCRDPDILKDLEAEEFLGPLLLGQQAKLAAKQRPLSMKDAARLFGRDVSPDAAKAATKLKELLSPLPPRRSR
jgi:hypothetical protein